MGRPLATVDAQASLGAHGYGPGRRKPGAYVERFARLAITDIRERQRVSAFALFDPLQHGVDGERSEGPSPGGRQARIRTVQRHPRVVHR